MAFQQKNPCYPTSIGKNSCAALADLPRLPSFYDKRKKRNVKGFAEFLWLAFAGGRNREARRAEKPSKSAVKKQRRSRTV
jgi:hypothetical protein